MMSDLTQLVPGQSVDCVILGFEEQQLKILILKWKAKGRSLGITWWICF